MNIKKNILFFAIILLLFESYSLANTKTKPNVAFGVAGFGGVFNAVASEGSNEFKVGAGYGGAIIVEAMFTNRLGIHSGIWFTEFNNKYYFQGVKKTWIDFLGRKLNLPIYLIVAFNKGIFTLNLLTGINVGYIFQSKLSQDDPILGHDQIDVIEDIGHYQVGLGFGLNFKFHLMQFSDIFFGITSEFYFTDLILERDGPDTYDHIYNAKFIVGFLFRTNLYPM